MAHIQIRDVPDAVHGELVRRAENAGKSLQQYLMGQLVILVDQPEIGEVLKDLRDLPKLHLSPSEIAQMVKDERARS